MASKFDNRLKEFGERWEVDRYLSAAGYLHPSVKPFFVALPKVAFLFSCQDVGTLWIEHETQDVENRWA